MRAVILVGGKGTRLGSVTSQIPKPLVPVNGKAVLDRQLDELRRYRVTEVNRPNRSLRRQKGKSDPVDAQAAARSVLAGTAVSVPKANDDQVEMIRLLKVALNGAIKSKTAAANTITSMSVALPDELREQLRGVSTLKMVRICSRFRGGELTSPTAAAKVSLRSIAKRYEALEAEIKALKSELKELVEKTAPQLVKQFGVGPDVAATLLCAAGDNPERLVNEVSFASLCGVSPVEASSGKTNRHRLNRGGNRQANKALYVIALTRLRYDERSQTYVAKCVSEGKSKKEAIRCLKRYIAREIYYILIADGHYRAAKKSTA